MTQTIDQRACELLAKHLGVSKIASCWPGENATCHADAALAALTEALTRIEELEGLADAIEKRMAYRFEVGSDYIIKLYFENVDDLNGALVAMDKRRATLTQGIKE